MYVCNCHGFTEKQVRRAGTEGVTQVSKVYAHMGVRPQCGKCAGHVRQVLQDVHGCAEECCAVKSGGR